MKDIDIYKRKKEIYELIKEYIELLYSLDYYTIKIMIDMDYELSKKKTYSKRLIDMMIDVDSPYYTYDRLGITIDDTLPYTEHEKESINTVINSKEDYELHYLALVLANESLNKNTTLD